MPSLSSTSVTLLLLAIGLPSLSFAFVPEFNCAIVPNPPPTKTASGVLFDLDGTLIDAWRMGYAATVAVLNKNNLGHVDLNEKIYHELCVYPTPERMARHAGLMPDDPDFEAIGKDLARQYDETYVKSVSPETAKFYDGLSDVLRNLPQQCKLGALTNACTAYGHAVLEANCPIKSSSSTNGFAIYDRFATIHGFDSVPNPKPHGSGLLQCATEMGGLNPKDCVYVGDSPGDGRAARAAGMVSVGVLWGSSSEEKLRGADTFDYLCRSVDELKALLPQL